MDWDLELVDSLFSLLYSNHPYCGGAERMSSRLNLKGVFDVRYLYEALRGYTYSMEKYMAL